MVVELRSNVRGERAAHLDLVKRNGTRRWHTELTSKAARAQQGWTSRASCSVRPNRRSGIERFDISHTMGEATVASARGVRCRRARCATSTGLLNIAGIEPGDDYAAMHQAPQRLSVPRSRASPTSCCRMCC